MTLLKHRPLVVGTLLGTTSFSHQMKQARSVPLDLLEVRLDTFAAVRKPLALACQSLVQLVREIKEKTKKPLLATLRADKERGIKGLSPTDLNNEERRVILQSVIPECEMLDIEIRYFELARDLTQFAHRRGVDVIHSFHDFSGPSGLSLLKKLADLSLRAKGDLFKAAISPKTEAQLNEFLNWGLTLKKPRPVLIGMGNVGLPSRYVGYSFGSLLTYGHLGEQAAPGQVSVKELVRDVTKIYSSG